MIGESLFISEETVRRHLKSIYKKLEVHSKSEAVAKALRSRLV
jgi:DNA-binding CsgD family transcriptional regulator